MSAPVSTLRVLVATLGLLALLAGCDAVSGWEGEAGETAAAGQRLLAQTSAPIYTYRIEAVYPHDRDAFTQGLVALGDTLYEGTGLYGASTLRRVDLITGAVVQQTALDRAYFGEGIVVVDDRIVQLTWREETGFVYDRVTFDIVDTFTYDHEGWGLTYDGTHLVVSDGTPTVRFWDPQTFEEVRRVSVTEDGRRTGCRVNELEMVEGELWANCWKTDLIARIDPATGAILAWVDLRTLLPEADRRRLQSGDVLNGIAYDAARDRLYVTGKRWPKLFAITVAPAPARPGGYEPV